jgi:hypothetical protein
LVELTSEEVRALNSIQWTKTVRDIVHAVLGAVLLQGYKLQVQKLQENLAKAVETLEQTKQAALMVSGV